MSRRVSSPALRDAPHYLRTCERSAPQRCIDCRSELPSPEVLRGCLAWHGRQVAAPQGQQGFDVLQPLAAVAGQFRPQRQERACDCLGLQSAQFGPHGVTIAEGDSGFWVRLLHNAANPSCVTVSTCARLGLLSAGSGRWVDYSPPGALLARRPINRTASKPLAAPRFSRLLRKLSCSRNVSESERVQSRCKPGTSKTSSAAC